MVSLPALPPGVTANEARQQLERSGWSQIGVGDWSWVMADASGALAARITPFDPAYRMYAEAVIGGSANRWLPRMIRLQPLARDGYVVVMERLWPAPEAAASAFCAALGLNNDSGYQAPPLISSGATSDADLASLRTRLIDLRTEGRRRYSLWGGFDIRPANVMSDGAGRLKLIDPIFLRGRDIAQALAAGRGDLLTDFSRGQLEDFLTIPVFEPGEATDRFRHTLADLHVGKTL